ncbi:MAG TPA: TonB-dependent receptor [Solimonas sp.]|nr:TonB-dependent receptor [Solimonas sp.]
MIVSPARSRAAALALLLTPCVWPLCAHAQDLPMDDQSAAQEKNAAAPEATPADEGAPPDAAATSPEATPADASAPPDTTATSPDAAPAEPAPEAAASAEPAPAEEPPAAPVETIPVETAKKPEGNLQVKEGTARLDTIQVTGSRLKRTDYETAQPVLVLSREDIDRTGLSDISQILAKISAAGNASINTNAQTRTTSLGETSLDLRNLGPQHTLILVNGRRWVGGLVSTGPSITDLNTIPTAIIERVEVLKDGASAIYGSDAIGGVVNIVTRKDYSGLGFNAQVGQFIAERDGQKAQYSLSWGLAKPDTSIFANLSYTEEKKALTSNREFTSSPMPAAGNTRWGNSLPQGRFLFVPTQTNEAFYRCPNAQAAIAEGALADQGFPGLAQQTAAIPAGVVVCDLTINDGAAGGSLADYHVRDKTRERFNHYANQPLQQPSKRAALFATLNQALTDNLDLSVEALYNMRRSTGVYGNLIIAGGNLLTGNTPNGYASAANVNNPFMQDLGNDPSTTGLGVGSGAWIIRMPEDSRANWHFDNEADTVRLATALSGNLDLVSRAWSWEAGYVYAKATNTETSPLYRFDRLGLAMGPTVDCTGDCVAFNPFNGHSGVTPEMLDYIYQDTVQHNQSRQDIVYASVATNLDEVSQWLAGPLALAGGIEYRRDEFSSHPDEIVRAGLTFLNAQEPTEGTASVKEGFVELGIPLLKDVIAAKALDLDLAARYSSYDGFSPVTTYKTGLRWNPTDDLLLRGTYSTGFRAPNIGELHVGSAQSFDPMDDPCVTPTSQAEANCTSDGVQADLAENAQVSGAYTIWSGNPNLKPEKSRNLTYGLVYSPGFIPQLNFNLDFYKIEIEQFITIGGPLGQFYLDSCYEVPDTERTYCDNIHRNPAGALEFVDTPYLNFNSVKTRGVDGGIDYVLPLSDAFGRFKIALDASYLAQYDKVLPRPGQSDRTEGTVGKNDLLSGWPRWKAGGSIVWKWDQFSASWATRMAYKMNEACQDPLTPTLSQLGLCSDPKVNEEGDDVSVNKLKTVYYHNVQLEYAFNQYDANVTLGVNNVLDQDPPPSYGFSGYYWYNYDPQHYETPGRFGYMRVGMKF